MLSSPLANSPQRPADSQPASAVRPNGILWVKVLLDYVLALMLFVALLPVLLLLGLLVRLTSRGPALYTQIRVGRHNRPFWIYKFRTMEHDCEKKSGIRWSVPGDNRITMLGKFLRASHLDELPQLINVLLGQMSLVGPRPERPEFTQQLAQVLPHYDDRHLVLPGVTGLAQVQLPPDSDLTSVARKLAYDRWYVAHRSLWLDVRLIFCTALKVFLIPMPITCRLLRIPSAIPATSLAHNEAPRPTSQLAPLPASLEGTRSVPESDPALPVSNYLDYNEPSSDPALVVSAQQGESYR